MTKLQQMADEKRSQAAQDATSTSASSSEVRDGRVYRVSSQRNQATGKLRYVEGSLTSTGCRFL